jgi:hypothetical protein
VTVTPEGFLYVPDLGRNAISVYKVDFAGVGLELVTECALSQESAGPRHFAASGAKGFVICELDNTVVAFDIDTATGRLTETGVASTLPEGWTAPPPFEFYHAPSHAAGILYDAAAGRVYATNRGHDSIAVLRWVGFLFRSITDASTPTYPSSAFFLLARWAPMLEHYFNQHCIMRCSIAAVPLRSVNPELKLIGTVPSEGRLPWTIGKVAGADLLLVSNQFNSALADPGNVALFSVAGDGLPTFVGTRGFATLSKVMCATVAPL